MDPARGRLKDARRLPVLGSRSVRLDDGTAAFVVRTADGVVAYENLCPHWGVDLDLGLEDFVDPRSGTITCRNHLAEFRVEDGLCIAGPCAGDRLPRLDARLEGDDALVERVPGGAP